jgi:hypothetical protein
MSFGRRVRTRTWCGIASLAAAMLLLNAAGVKAEVRISGNTHSLVLEAHNAPLRDVLNAFRSSFNVEYKASAGLQRQVTGTYSGSLKTVLARLLSGQNYIIRSTSRGLTLAILGAAGTPQAAGFMRPPPGGPPTLMPHRATTAQAPPAPNGMWRDGDGQVIAPPAPKVTRFAGPNATPTWRDGDGQLIAPPPGRRP